MKSLCAFTALWGLLSARALVDVDAISSLPAARREESQELYDRDVDSVAGSVTNRDAKQNLQPFTGSLGGAAPPVYKKDGVDVWTTEGNDFKQLRDARVASCMAQRTACNAAVASNPKITGDACYNQYTRCYQAADSKQKREMLYVDLLPRHEHDSPLNFGSCKSPGINFTTKGKKSGSNDKHSTSKAGTGEKNKPQGVTDSPSGGGKKSSPPGGPKAPGTPPGVPKSPNSPPGVPKSPSTPAGGPPKTPNGPGGPKGPEDSDMRKREDESKPPGGPPKETKPPSGGPPKEGKPPGGQPKSGKEGEKNGMYEPADGKEFKHKPTEKIKELGTFICKELETKCKAPKETVESCKEGLKEAVKLKGEDAAEKFNRGLGVAKKKKSGRNGKTGKKSGSPSGSSKGSPNALPQSVGDGGPPKTSPQKSTSPKSPPPQGTPPKTPPSPGTPPKTPPSPGSSPKTPPPPGTQPKTSSPASTQPNSLPPGGVAPGGPRGPQPGGGSPGGPKTSQPGGVPPVSGQPSNPP